MRKGEEEIRGGTEEHTHTHTHRERERERERQRRLTQPAQPWVLYGRMGLDGIQGGRLLDLDHRAHAFLLMIFNPLAYSRASQNGTKRRLRRAE